MADFAGTVTLKAGPFPAFANHPGLFAFQIALSAASYVGGNLNLSTIAPMLKGIEPADIAHISFEAGATPGYVPNWTPAATPTWANLGTLKLFVAGGGVAATSSTAIPAAVSEGALSGDALAVCQKLNALIAALGAGDTVVKTITGAALAEASGTLTFTIRGVGLIGRLKT